MPARKNIYNGVNLDGALAQVITRSEQSNTIKGVLERRRDGCERKFGIDFDWFVKLHVDSMQAEAQLDEKGRIGRNLVPLMKSLGEVMGYYPQKITEEDDKEAIEATYQEIREDLDKYLEEHKREY